VLYYILKQPETNILCNLTPTEFRTVRKGVLSCILATDMAKHKDILTAFSNIVPNFDYASDEHRAQLLMMIVKCSDISNEVRPAEVAEPWVDCLLQEFFAQSDAEKKAGLPVAPFMDRDKVTKPNAQIG
jgi:high affinity cGMP-specific 3',5'-cyclic phosphodiesterase 9